MASVVLAVVVLVVSVSVISVTISDVVFSKSFSIAFTRTFPIVLEANALDGRVGIVISGFIGANL